MDKQVDKSHYAFNRYLSKQRWASMWHQLDEVLAFQPESVLEIGPGPGVFKAVSQQFIPRVETLDIDPDLGPDHVESADDMPFPDNSYDVVCAFQMLEHVPYDMSLAIFKEMIRVSRKGVVISLPDAQPAISANLHIPMSRPIRITIKIPWPIRITHKFDGQHFWEINKAGYATKKIIEDLKITANQKNPRTFRVVENPYHRFIVLKKTTL